MTRKHYKIAAESFLNARKKINASEMNDDAKNKSLETITELECNLIHMFIGDNPRFSVMKFLAASK
jgi:hypothetical protein